MSETNPLIETITAEQAELRDRSLFELCRSIPPQELLGWCDQLEQFRRRNDNLYERVRAALFLHAAYRFFLRESPHIDGAGTIPLEAFEHLLERRFERAIRVLRAIMHRRGPDAALISILATAYHQLAFKTLTDQVRRSVRASRGNGWMFRVGHPADHPLRLRRELLERSGADEFYPILLERTPVRLDLSHSGWSDIFFLGMDYPSGARVLNLSVDLAVHGRDECCQPPIATFARAISEPILRLTSIDLNSSKEITSLDELFNFGNDYLGLLKAGVIAAGIVPPSFEGTGRDLASILDELIAPGMGLELVTQVHRIPKGSRLAVSTNLLASIIALLMRASGQTESLEGPLLESERRLVAARAILGEWLGGSGGGWQDSGGIWPGLKLIEGVSAAPGDPEYGISRGCLLPRHRRLGSAELHPQIHELLETSLVPIHGGMAQDVGPILEMVTEKYLLRGAPEWRARRELGTLFDTILDALGRGDIETLARSTDRAFAGPLREIIPAVTNLFTETILARVRARFPRDFLGFVMLGGMSGGGMGLFVRPGARERFRDEVRTILHAAKEELEEALPFAIDPLVYEFRINCIGSAARLLASEEALLPQGYYAHHLPRLARRRPEEICEQRRRELVEASGVVRDAHLLHAVVGNLFQGGDSLARKERRTWDEQSEKIKRAGGFDPIQHEEIRAQLRAGRIGLAHNRLPIETLIEDARDTDLLPLTQDASGLGREALKEGRVAVLTLAAGVGSRWTTGAGVVKAINPFVEISGRQRSFLEIHLAKTRRRARVAARAIPHLIATSFLTHDAIEGDLGRRRDELKDLDLRLSPGRSIGQRFIPMVRDLVTLWEETPEELLDPEKQKLRESLRDALKEWARDKGEGSDYIDNIPRQRLHPTGHWYEVPALLRNGVLARLLRERPQLETLFLHNIDTLGADLDPAVLGRHLESGATLTFEVVARRFEDRGGGLARVGGRLRLLEGMAQPREEDEFGLRYYNTMSTWIRIDALLASFGLERSDLQGPGERIDQAVRRMAQRVPTYITIKDVKLRWGHGQEDVYPVAQFEKLWSDMSALGDLSCAYLAVPRSRGQQLKAPAQLDAWLSEGSRELVAALCAFS